MNSIYIKNVGALKEINLDLKKINVIIGPQSSGKSTIAKIISYCQWVEKRFLLDGKYDYDISDQLLNFHRIGYNYFNSDSKIIYTSTFVEITITLENNDLKEVITGKNNNLNYKKTKNIYIPAERNFVSVIPNLGKYKETNDNIMSFLYDWYSTKSKFTKSNILSILDLGIDYYHMEDSDSDMLILKENKKEIYLREGSSGLQSLIPLTMLVEYLTNQFYNENQSTSFNETDSLKEILNREFLDNFFDELIKKRKKLSKKEIDIEISKLIDLVRKRSLYDHTNFIIEEPEQNLFPKTQRDLIYFLFEKVNTQDRNHNLTITTHSPYILYSINNCLMGYNIAKEMPSEEIEELKSSKAWINPEFVSLYEINEGKIRSIKDLKTNTVTKHYFNENLNEIMDEYYEMLNYFSQL